MVHFFLQNVDALFRGEGVLLPSTVILDYHYDIAAYKAWCSKRGNGFIQTKVYRKEHYARIPPPPPALLEGIDDSDTDVTPGPDDPNDSDYNKEELSGVNHAMVSSR
jgi:hypothetical protein